MAVEASGLSMLLDGVGEQLAQRRQLAALQAAGVPTGNDTGILSRLMGAVSDPQAAMSSAASSVAPGMFPPAAAPSASPMAYAPASDMGGGGASSAIANMIGQSAQKYGIDPMTAIRVAKSEGGLSPATPGDGGSSFGPFQLHYGGVAAGGNSVGGLGDDFTRDTGLDARDPKNVAATIDYALRHAAQHGWSAFHGAARSGIGAFSGIGGQRGGAPAPVDASSRAAPSMQMAAYEPQNAMNVMPKATASSATAMNAAPVSDGSSTPASATLPGNAMAFAGPTPSQAPAVASAPPPGNAAVMAPGAASAPSSAGTAVPSQLTAAQIGALIREPSTREMGLKLWQMSLSPKEGYTLKEGERRYDFGNHLVASGIDKPVALSQGQALYGSGGGAPIAFNPKGPEYKPEVVNGRVVAFDTSAGTARDATPAGMPQGFRPATADERKSYGVPAQTPLFVGPDGKPQTLSGGTNVTVNNAVNPILEGLGKQFVESTSEARSSADTVRAIQGARAQLQASGGITAGAFADERLQLQKLGQLVGVGNPDQITNTETFRTQIKPIVLSTVKGLGAGSGISNADRDFAEAAVGGSIKLDPSTIQRVLDITERAGRAKIARHNALADQMLKTQPSLAEQAPLLKVPAPDVVSGGATTPPVQGARQASDGHWYVADPARPGKYQRVDP